MPRNGLGQYNLPSGNPVVPNTSISSNWANTTLTDMANALSTSLAVDGQTVPTANLPMAGFRHTNVANAQNRTDYASAGQVQDAALTALSAVAGSDTITASLVPAPAGYVVGARYVFTPAANNATTTPTLNINGYGAKPMVDGAGAALPIGALVAGVPYEIYFDGTSFRVGGYGMIVNAQAKANSAAATANAALPLSGGSMAGALVAPQITASKDSQTNYGSAALVSMTASTTVGDAMIALVASGQYAVTIQTNRAVSNSLAFRLNSSGTPYANLEVADGTQPYHAATYGQLTTGLNGKQNSLGYTPVNKAGDTLTGGLTYTSTDPVFGAINEYYAGNSAYGFKVFGYVNTGVDYEFHIADEQGNDRLVIPKVNPAKFAVRPLFAGATPWDSSNLANPAHADGSYSWTSIWTGNSPTINLYTNFGFGIYLIQIGSGAGRMIMICTSDGGSVTPATGLVAAGDNYNGTTGSAAIQIWRFTKG